MSNTAECEALMAKGWGNRAVGATKMNADSSRSHSIFTINIEMLDTGATGNEHIRKVTSFTDRLTNRKHNYNETQKKESVESMKMINNLERSY